ncbi:hypothetical protein SAMN03080598_02812 [Algoriphagus boritolerans DSM 17298 = JCM 18970]|uniref:Uncharacterized protein n=1 Tax=Algoriphagus boritolerans DSM 17298 = JCM 18970 TaxID=1120964 RepID=A0A1H5Y570_9BACT|nr:hypothetical protein SAMN03080598_02812 [Algoriphagus boritolerans DSM 17298 = JCM 18970]
MTKAGLKCKLQLFCASIKFLYVSQTEVLLFPCLRQANYVLHLGLVGSLIHTGS